MWIFILNSTDIQNSKIKIDSPNIYIHKNIKQYNCFSIGNNKKCFMSSKSAYYNDFWRIKSHWRVMPAEIQKIFHNIDATVYLIK